MEEMPNLKETCTDCVNCPEKYSCKVWASIMKELEEETRKVHEMAVEQNDIDTCLKAEDLLIEIGKFSFLKEVMNEED